MPSLNDCFLLNNIPHNQKELLGLVAENDESAFSRVFEFYRDRVYSIAYKITKSNVIAEEIVQDVFLKVWQRRGKLSHVQNFNAYLFVMTRNDVYKALKGIARSYTLTVFTDEDKELTYNNTSDLLLEKEYTRVLQNAIDRLPNQQKQVYHLVKDHGLKRDEVAYKLQIQPETVKYHLAQAMKNIRGFCMLYISMVIAFTILFIRFFRIN